ncbi:MAG: hypothetical protein ACXVJD_03450 [Mucilaginibacter sp.]
MSDNDFNKDQHPEPFPNPQPQEEGLGTGLTILSFCIPIVGIVLYFTNKGTAPKKSTTACYAALAGIGVGILVRVLTMALSNP